VKHIPNSVSFGPMKQNMKYGFNSTLTIISGINPFINVITCCAHWVPRSGSPRPSARSRALSAAVTCPPPRDRGTPRWGRGGAPSASSSPPPSSWWSGWASTAPSPRYEPSSEKETLTECDWRIWLRKETLTKCEWWRIW